MVVFPVVAEVVVAVVAVEPVDINQNNHYTGLVTKNTKSKNKLSFTKTLLGLSALLAVFATTATKIDTSLKVKDIIDGDTFITSNNQRVRLFGANAPESGNCYSSEAKSHLESLILNKKVILAEPRADVYGRVVALVYQNNQLVNIDMVKNGYARYEGEISSQKDQFQQANLSARENNLGIYSSLCYQLENPNNPSCNIKGNIEKSTETKTYHLPSCGEYNRTIIETSLGEQWFCSEAEAIEAGYIKSKNCHH